jgi:EmrB/QacA subfamily drug resistance transporter
MEITPSPESKPEHPIDRHARWALAGLSLSMLLSSLGTSIANVSLPTLTHAFGASFQDVQWVVLAYLLSITALIVSAGRMGDIVGRRRLLLAGVLAFSAASGVAALAPSLGVLVAARAAQGIGASAMMALTMAFVGETVPKGQTGRAMGLLGTMSAVGTALGPSLGGLLIASSGWRSIFLVNVPLGIAAAFLVHRYLPADRERQLADKTGFDWLGTSLLGGTLASYALAMTIGRGHFGSLNLVLLLGAVVGGIFFVMAESKVAAPLVPLGFLKDATLRSGLFTSGLVSTVMMTTLVVGPFYLSLALGLKSAAVGLVLSVGPMVAALTGVPAGRLADRFGAQRVTLYGLIGIALGAALLAALPAPLGVVGYLAPLVAITVCYALFQTANNTAVMREVPPDRRGVISGLLNLSRNLGLVTGASVMGAVFAFASMTDDITTAGPSAVAMGMRVTFGAAVALIAGAILITLRGGKTVAPPDSAK